MKKITLTYLYSYLLGGGIGFAFAPRLTLEIFMSNGDYGDTMPRMVGMFMLALGFLIFQFVRKQDYTYYLATIIVRAFIVFFLGYLYFSTRDPLFLIVNGIVLIGLLPSIFVYIRDK